MWTFFQAAVCSLKTQSSVNKKEGWNKKLLEATSWQSSSDSVIYFYITIIYILIPMAIDILFESNEVKVSKSSQKDRLFKSFQRGTVTPLAPCVVLCNTAWHVADAQYIFAEC